MRKSSKVLALILTFVLLMGAFTVASFANEEEIESVDPVIDVSNQEGTIVFHGGTDFKDANFTRHNTGSTGTLPDGAGSSAVSVKSHAHFDSRNYMGNTYAAYWFDKDEKNAEGENIAIDSSKGNDAYHDIYIGDYIGEADSVPGNLTTNTLGRKCSLMANDYIVIDWDFCADKYVLDDALTDTWAEGATLSYTSNFTMTFTVRGGGTDSVFGMGSSVIKLGKDAGGYYIFNHTDATQKAYLSQNVGEWNHVTVIIEVNNKIDITIDGQYKPNTKFMDAVALAMEGGRTKAEAMSYVINNATNYQLFDSQLHMFLNGDHFSSVKYLEDKTSSMGENNYFTKVVGDKTYYISPAHFYAYNIRMNDGSKTDVNYSIGLDNVTTHYYKSGYKTPEGSDRNLSSFMTYESYKTKNLAYCDDVVFNGKYQTPNPNKFVASVTAAGVTTGYYTKQGAEDALVENAMLIVADGTKYTDFIATFKFYVKITNPEDFGIRNSHEYSMAPTTEENVYVVKPANELNSVQVDIYDFLFDEWGNQIAIEHIDALYEGTVPALTDESLFTKPTFFEKNPDLKDGIYSQFDGWNMYYRVSNSGPLAEGDVEDKVFGGYWRLAPASMITSEMAQNNEDYGIFLFPRYADVQYSYSIVDAYTGALVEGIDYTDISAFTANVNSVTNSNSKGTYIVTLYKDAGVTYRGSETYAINVAQETTLYFDLNGHDYVVSFEKYNAKGSSFSVKPKAEFYLYSSKEGGRAFNASNRYNVYAAGGASLITTDHRNCTSGGVAKIYVGKVDTEVNGIKIKADGNNLFTSSALLVEAGTSVNYYLVYDVDPKTGAITDVNADGIIGMADKKENATTYYNEIYIDGGTYTRPNADGGGLIKTNSYLAVEVKNANLVGGSLFATDSRYNPRITGTVDNCILNAMSGNIFGQFCEGSELTITNSVLIGSLAFSGCTYNWSDSANTADVDERIYSITTSHPMHKNAKNGKVYLGEGCKISNDNAIDRYDGTKTVAAAAGMNAVEINESYNEYTYWFMPVYATDPALGKNTASTTASLVEGCLTNPINLTNAYPLVKGYTALDKKATINWMSGDQTLQSMTVTLIGPKFYSNGIAPTVDTTTPIPGTKMFKLGVDTWIYNGEALPTTLVIKEGDVLTFNAVMGGIVAPGNKELAPIIQSMETKTKFSLYINVPKYDAHTVEFEGVTYLVSESSFKFHHNDVNYGSTSTINGTKYFKYIYSHPSPKDLGNQYSVSISYTVTKVVDPEDASKNVVETFTLNYKTASLGEYLKAVFEASTDAAETKLIANMIQYCLVTCDASGQTGAEVTALRDLVKDNAKYINSVTDIDSDAFGEKITTRANKTPALPAGLENYVESIVFYNASYAPTIAIIPVNNVVEDETPNILSVKLLYTSFDGKGNDMYMPIAVPQGTDYKDALGATLTGQKNSSTLGYFMSVNTHLPSYVLNNVFTFQVYVIDNAGEENETKYTITFTYTLADYILELEKDESQAKYARMLKALAAYSEASVEYIRTADTQ